MIEQSNERPNIILILSDQQRWDSLGCYGQKLPTTPTLDKLASDGVRFQYAFSNQPLCTPARSILLTGKYATESNVWMLNIALPTDAVTYPKLLNQNGYLTAYIGKWHLGETIRQYARPGNFPGQQKPFLCKTKPIPEERRGGFKDYWVASEVLEVTSEGYGGYLFDKDNKRVEVPKDRYRVDGVTDIALNYLNSIPIDSSQQPFFLALSFLEPHWQNDKKTHVVPSEFQSQFTDYEIPADIEDPDKNVSWLKEGFRKEYPRYLGTVRSIDDNVKRIMDVLKTRGMYENTIIIYSSDHGCHFGQRSKGAKSTCHDASIRIPLIISGGNVAKNQVNKNQVSQLDLAPTILSLAGVEAPSAMRGRNLISDDLNKDNIIYFQTSAECLGRGIRTPKWKYFVQDPLKRGLRRKRSSIYRETHLYDLETDPHELRNVIKDPNYKEIRLMFREKLLQWIKQVEGKHPVIFHW